MDINIKLANEKDVQLRVDIIEDETNPNSLFFVLTSVDDGKLILKLQYINDKLEILEKDSEIGEDLDLLKDKIEELLVQINPNNQIGTENTDKEDEEVEAPYDPETIRVDTKSFSLRQIYDMMKAGDIDLAPDFQRHLVWDNPRKSRLIESILLRIPLPMFYFAQDEDGRISVVDGLQRLSTIREFMDNQLKLRNLEYLEDKCGEKYYSDKDREGKSNGLKAIEPKYFRWFNMTQITVNVIDPSSPFKLKYDIFRRINTGGQPLNSQEIRNCLASSSLRKALKSMANLDSFKEATGYSIKDVRMEAQELALRFILFFTKYKSDRTLDNYSGNIDYELNELTENLSKDKNRDFSEYINLFDHAMRNAYHLFGQYSFRKTLTEHLEPGTKRQLINKALFVSWSVQLAQFDSTVITSKYESEYLILPLAQAITEDKQLFMYLTYGTNSKANIKYAFDVASQILSNKIESII